MKRINRDFFEVKGSLTVEAAFIVPIVLFCILLILNQGLEMYSQTVEIVRKQEIWKEFEPVENFRKLELLEDCINL